MMASVGRPLPQCSPTVCCFSGAVLCPCPDLAHVCIEYLSTLDPKLSLSPARACKSKQLASLIQCYTVHPLCAGPYCSTSWHLKGPHDTGVIPNCCRSTCPRNMSSGGGPNIVLSLASMCIMTLGALNHDLGCMQRQLLRQPCSEARDKAVLGIILRMKLFSPGQQCPT